MPIWLRKFTFNSIQDHYDKVEKINKQSNNTKTPEIKGPDISPSYSSKASRK